MENPFSYFPNTAKKLKEMDKSSAAFKKAVRKLSDNSLFSTKLTECVVEEIQSGDENDNVREISADTKMMFGFMRFGILCTSTATLAMVVLTGGFLHENYIYIYAAAVLTVPFIVYYGRKVKKHMTSLAEKYLDRYRLPDKRFSDERIRELIAVRTSKTDVISTHELKNGIQCGCYTCLSRYPSNALTIVEESAEYVCPVCGKTTIISERCGHSVTDELLQDMHDYWQE